MLKGLEEMEQRAHVAVAEPEPKQKERRREAPTMRAVRIHKFGGAETLAYELAPMPAPAEGEVLIRVHAAGVNPLDVKVREGLIESRAKHTLPLVLGWDVAGEVEAAGPGVTEFRPGDEVFGRTNFARDGAYAEHLVAGAKELARRPEALDPIRAAAMPIAGLTAWQALFDVAGLTSGQKILIHRAAGGVGSFAVQLARSVGAIVVGTASGPNVEFVKGLGADEVIDYTQAAFEDVVRDCDVVLDSIGGEVQKRSWKTLKPGGILVSIVSMPSEVEAAKLGAKATWMLVHPDPAQLRELANRVVSGTLAVHIERVLPLSDARLAHEAIEAGHVRGKLVLRID